MENNSEDDDGEGGTIRFKDKLTFSWSLEAYDTTRLASCQKKKNTHPNFGTYGDCILNAGDTFSTAAWCHGKQRCSSSAHCWIAGNVSGFVALQANGEGRKQSTSCHWGDKKRRAFNYRLVYCCHFYHLNMSPRGCPPLSVALALT